METINLPVEFRRALSDILEADAIVETPEELSAYGTDWTRVYPPNPCAIVFPRTAEEVSAVMKAAYKHDIAVVPSGGRTGLAAGAVAANGELVVSLDRMRKMDPVDQIARTVRVEAGAITQSVHAHAQESGLTWPVDFAASGSSQIGGNISTNAGGVRVVRYGLTRQWVLGLEVVTPTGEIVHLNGALEKNNTGLDLRQMFIGTEGTLGIITAATLKLTTLPGQTQVALLAVEDVSAALQVFKSARMEQQLVLQAFEYFSDECLDIVLNATDLPQPLEDRYPGYLLVEVEAGPGADLATASENWLTKLFEEGLVVDGVLSASLQQSGQLWAYRERISESLTHTGFVYKNDVALPVSSLADFSQEMLKTFTERYPDFGVYVFGHVGDGNLHINIMKPDDMDKEHFLSQCHGTDDLLFKLIQSYKGSISAEHGIGLLKKKFIGFTRTDEELALFRRVKEAFDPKGLLNPTKIIDL